MNKPPVIVVKGWRVVRVKDGKTLPISKVFVVKEAADTFKRLAASGARSGETFELETVQGVEKVGSK